MIINVAFENNIDPYEMLQAQKYDITVISDP